MTKRTARPAQSPTVRTQPVPGRDPGRPISPPRRHPLFLVASAIALVAWLAFLTWMAFKS